MGTCRLNDDIYAWIHGYTWKIFLKFYLEPLTSFGQTLLKQVRDRRQTSLLGLLQDGVAQRIQGARGLAVGV